MFDSFSNHIEKEKFFSDKSRIILAASAGIDSMCLFHLMNQCGLSFEVAHFDHLTREGKSSLEAEFVKSICDDKSLPFNIGVFDKTKPYNNFQDEARRQRYQFFKSLNPDCLVTAHHKDDTIETIFMNFIRGKSLKGIDAVNDNIVRPLLQYSKAEIIDYSDSEGIPFIEDESNFDNNYLRNFVRNESLPQIKTQIDKLEERLISLSNRFEQKDRILYVLAKKVLDIRENTDLIFITIESIQSLKEDAAEILSVALKTYGFNTSQSYDMVRSISETGKLFESSTHKALIDRKNLIIEKLDSGDKAEEISITLSSMPCTMKFSDSKFTLEISESTEELTCKMRFQIPISSVSEKVILRLWRPGDVFYPSGMNMQSQSLKKYFTNIKMDRFSKAKQVLLCHENGDIMWICGMRKDERYCRIAGSGRYLTVTMH